jgi:glycosyltransferase involved in cell wall biosynthesis
LNLMIGTDPAGRGGVASVVTVLVNEGFLRENNIRYVASHSDGSAFRKLVLACASLLSVLGICAFSRPLVVHVHSASRASFYRKSLLLAVARAFGCKTIFHLHGGEFRQFATDESGPLVRWWIRRTLEKSSKVIALSDSWAAFISQYAPKANVLVVPNSVKLSVVSSPLSEEAGRILFLGRLGKGKGVFELLTAVSLLKNTCPGIKLVLGGDGDLAAVQSAVQDLHIEERVDILGWIGPEQKAQELVRASVFTLPSYDEGLPMAMLEAMAAGKAIVVTAVGGIPEAVKDGENGLLISPRDVGALAAALKIVLAEPLLRRSLATNARKTIEERFSTDVVMAKLSALYGDLGGVTKK